MYVKSWVRQWNAAISKTGLCPAGDSFETKSRVRLYSYISKCWWRTAQGVQRRRVAILSESTWIARAETREAKFLARVWQESLIGQWTHCRHACKPLGMCPAQCRPDYRSHRNKTFVQCFRQHLSTSGFGCCLERVSYWVPLADWSLTHRDLPVSAAWVLDLKVCAPHTLKIDPRCIFICLEEFTVSPRTIGEAPVWTRLYRMT